MFGGLSIKGETKEELAPAPAAAAAPTPAPAPASGSGFSFLQSSIVASATPAPVAASSGDDVAAAEPQSKLADSSAGLAIAGSAFGFMSSGVGSSATSGVGKEEPPVAAAPPAPSMFAGLTTSSSAKEPAAAPSSGFSFLSVPSPAAPPQPSTIESTSSSEPAAAAPSGGGSGFSFLSAPAAAATAPAESSANDNGVDAASTASTAGSSFSFMGSMASSVAGSEHKNGAGGEASLAAVKEKEEAPAVSRGASAGGMSGFSFMSSATAAAPAPPPSEGPPLEQPPSLISESAKLEEITKASAPAKARAPGDLLSISNPGLPAGSGVSWSAPPVGAKKVVKKKRRTRVGVGSTSTGATELPAPNSIPEPKSSSFQPPSIPGGDPSTPQRVGFAPPSANGIPQMPATPSSPDRGGALHLSTTPVRVKAERAMDKADEFIKEKQRKSAIAMAAERAMQDRSSSMGSSSDGWKTNNAALTSSPGSPNNDDTYRAAKAAAAEAQKLATGHASHSKGKGKGSLFSNFFHRKGGGSNSSNHGISSHSSHGGVVVSPAPGKGFQRGGSNGSAGAGASTHGSIEGSGHGPLPTMHEKVEIASYGEPRPMDSEASPEKEDPVSQEDKSKELEEERQIRLELQRQQQERREAELREAAAVQAEIRRRKEQRERRQREEEEDRERKLEEERLRRRSPRAKMQGILDHLADATRTSTDNVTVLRAKRAELVKERARAEKAERYAEQQAKFAETQQTLAAEEEDFESADRLAGVIEKHVREKGEQSKICKQINESILKLDKEKEAASKAVAACFNSVHAKMKELEGEVDDRLKEEGVLDQFATTSKRLSSETARLANDLKHIERDEQVWKEESKELTGQIEEETKEFAEKCSEASTKLEQVNQTIEDLRKQLAEAESTASELTTEIATHNKSIEKIKTKYSRQLARLEKKEQSVKESRWDWESEKESIEKAQAAHEAVVAAHSEDMLSREKLIGDIKSESSVAKEFVDIVSSAFAYVRTEGKSTTSDLDSEVSKYEAAVNEAERNVAAAESNIQNLEEELAAIDVRVPILEAEKKLAAGKRDFKAAGKASREIKEALARKERCAAALMGEAMECRKSAREEHRKVSALLEEKKAAAAEKGREAGLELMGLVRGKINELRSMLKRFASSDTEKFGTERWGEDEEDTITVACVGAFVIESQIFVLEAEGKSLGEKYGGWDSPDDIVEDSSVQSAPTFDSADDDENDSEIVIDKVVLEKYIAMRNEMKELEGAIEEAAEEEDFDKAAELEEQAQAVREEFKAAGFMTEKFERALKGFTNKGSGAVAADSAENGNNSSVKAIENSVLEKYASLSTDIKELKASIEAAVAGEDYDKAAELEEKIQSAQSDIESLGVPLDDLEAAMKNTPATASAGNNDETQEAGGETDNTEEKIQLAIPLGELEKAPENRSDAGANTGEEVIKLEGKGDASPKCGDNLEECRDELNVDDANINGESVPAHQGKDAVDNTDAAEDK